MEREHGGRQTTARPRHFMTHGHRVSAWSLGRLPLQPLIKLDQARPSCHAVRQEGPSFFHCRRFSSFLPGPALKTNLV